MARLSTSEPGPLPDQDPGRIEINRESGWWSEPLSSLTTQGSPPIVGPDSERNGPATFLTDPALLEVLERSHRDLRHAYDATIEGWSRALELRDKETQGHSQRVTTLTMLLAREMGVAEERIEHIRRGALLHDIGKMGIPDSILLKPGPLTVEEWAIMEMHPTYALQMLWPITFLRPALEIPYCHHERWDGSGYPQGLRGEAIPLAARIFAAVDIWDALSHDRPYRPAWPQDRILEHIRGLAGTHLDPAVVEVFLRWLEFEASLPAPTPVKPATSRLLLPSALPQASDLRSEPRTRPEPALPWLDRNGSPPPLKILVAEDDPDVADLLRALLEEAGHAVVVATDGLVAWEHIQKAHVPLVLTDWTMPGLEGPELCRRIRRLEGRPYTYVMLLTARTSSPERIEGLRAGADDFLIKPLDRHELIARVEIARRILTMQADILARTDQAERLASELQFQNERLSELAWTDGLTGLCNRRRFLEALEAGLSLSARRGLPLSVALLDVDHFKNYNDDFGHQAGDEVLRQLATILRNAVRAHDLVGRYGGEEFLILLPDTDQTAAVVLADRLRLAIDSHTWPLRHVTASLGVSTASLSTRDASRLVHNADEALYRSKRRGRNRVTHHDDPFIAASPDPYPVL